MIMKKNAITVDQLPLGGIQWTPHEDVYIPPPDESRVVLDQTDITSADPIQDHLGLLFELHKRAPPWASFSPPQNFRNKSKRCHLFFHKNLLPGVHLPSLLERYEEELAALQASSELFSPEASESLLDCLELLKALNDLLWLIQSRVLQFRKG